MGGLCDHRRRDDPDGGSLVNDVFGHNLPPRYPAEAARADRRARARAALRAHLQLQSMLLIETLLDLLRVGGVVLFVLKIIGLWAGSVWVAVTLCFAPTIAAAGATLAGYAWARYVRWRVDREVL